MGFWKKKKSNFSKIFEKFLEILNYKKNYNFF